ncbi:MAG TPA: NAD(P)/FAD-dependent oxidoreductase [Solirubrobacteraceae bacterium]|nr:NAD(P)/FAD-dependent oxidoreductase [Solirubrobacteraceae bacterium]
MPARATKRGADRTRLERDCDVLVCGASFAGLAVAGELAGTGARVLVIDRYEIGERQTSACGIPTVWLERLDLQASLLQTFDELKVHTPWASVRWHLPWTFSTFDYRELCALMWEQAGASPIEFETAAVQRREGDTVHTDRGELRAPLIVDCLGWRRVLSNAAPIQPPNARLSRGLEVHPGGAGEEMELWLDPRYVRSGYSWSFPARDEVRIGVGSFWPAHHVKQPTLRLAEDLGMPPEGFQGNWIPHELRPATEDGVFFVGDSAGHCLPLTAEGIRTALYFGIACGRELRAVVEGHAEPESALRRYAAFSDAHEWKYRWLLRTQQAVGQLMPSRSVTALVRALGHRGLCNWAFEHYMRIAPPQFVGRGLPRPPRPAAARPVAASV